MIPPRHPLTFTQLRIANLARCCEAFHALEDWTFTDYGTALAGEVGEALNLVKKMRRGEPIDRAAVALELADAAIYLDLLAARLGVDLGNAIAHKFNRVSELRKSMFKLLPDPNTPCPLGAYLSPDNIERHRDPAPELQWLENSNFIFMKRDETRPGGGVSW